MKAIFLATTLLVSGLAFSPAMAAPVAPISAAPAVESPLMGVQLQLQYRGDRDDNRRDMRRDRRDDRRYRAGQRYRTAPNGWHRYDRRPSDWSSRRCGQVGNIWFCP
ncbi:MAG: hypothetical protein Q7T81_00250 [Pseudolabrys sp.]|nr:hypothetical protein [Pseudolabrys sp.]